MASAGSELASGAVDPPGSCLCRRGPGVLAGLKPSLTLPWSSCTPLLMWVAAMVVWSAWLSLILLCLLVPCLLAIWTPCSSGGGLQLREIALCGFRLGESEDCDICVLAVRIRKALGRGDVRL